MNNWGIKEKKNRESFEHNPPRPNLVPQILDRNKLFVASHSNISSGPSYTFHSGGYSSTIDYILVNGPCCGLLASCKGLPDHPLNVSDHVPLTISLNATASETTTQSVPKRIHWERAVSTGAIVNFTKGVEECACLYVNSHPDDITALEREIQSVSEQVINIAHSMHSPS